MVPREEECGAPLVRGNCNLPFGHTEEHGWRPTDMGAQYIYSGGCIVPIILLVIAVVASL